MAREGLGVLTVLSAGVQEMGQKGKKRKERPSPSPTGKAATVRCEGFKSQDTMEVPEATNEASLDHSRSARRLGGWFRPMAGEDLPKRAGDAGINGEEVGGKAGWSHGQVMGKSWTRSRGIGKFKRTWPVRRSTASTPLECGEVEEGWWGV